MSEPLAVFEYTSGDLDGALLFFKRTRDELRTLRKVHVAADRIELFDVNGDSFEIRGLGYADPDVVPVLQSVNTAFDPERIQTPVDAPHKEFKTGRRYPWAWERVM
jgi:hypothetical protein